MKLEDIINKSTLIITGTIIPEKMQMIYGILQSNVKIFNKFSNLVVILNTIDENGESYLSEYRNLINDLLNNPKIYHLRDYINRGWQFGTIDIEKTAYDFVLKNISYEAILKVDFDIYLEEQLLNIDISNADAMIMPSIGYSTVVEEYNSDFDKLMQLYDTIPPQSTIYLILNKMDYLYVNPNWLNKKYKEWILNPIGNGPHHIGVACEPLLRQSFERNNFKIKNMISKQSFRNLLETIHTHKIVDPSHKNLFFEEVGVCHLYDDTQNIIKIGDR